MFDVIVVGAGPSGLSCAIEAQKEGLACIVLEKGSVVDAIRRFPTSLIWFSTPELLEIGGLPFVINTVRPTRADAIAYYQRVVRHFNLAIRTFDSVEEVARESGRFVVRTSRGARYEAKNVVIATGYYDSPNRLGIPGESLQKVFHYYDEAYRYNNAEVAVVGGRNSAVETALDLFRHGARVTLIHRGEKLSDGVKYWILPDIENRIKSGEIKALFRTQLREVTATSIVVETDGERKTLPNDFVFVHIGFTPDGDRLKRFGVEIVPETQAPRQDARTFETSTPGLYVAGSAVGGKNNNKVFVENGRLHGQEIVASIIANKRSLRQGVSQT